MQGDDFVAENVFSCRERGGDCDGPGVVLADHFDGCPFAVLVAVGIDLGPFKVLLSDGGDIAGVRGDVGDYGSHV